MRGGAWGSHSRVTLGEPWAEVARMISTRNIKI
jgi:hypothetical protein